MKKNKFILPLIIAITVASNTFAVIKRLTGPAIGQAIIILKKEIPAGAKVSTPAEYRSWFNKIVTLMARLGESRPKILDSTAHSKPTLTELFKKYSDEAYDRVIQTVGTETPQEAEKNIAIIEQTIEQAQDTIDEMSNKHVHFADEVGKQLKEVKEFSDKFEDIQEVIPEAQEFILEESKEEQEKLAEQVDQEEQKDAGFWQNIKTSVSNFFKKDPKLAQLDTMLEENLKGKISAKLNAEIKKQGEAKPFVPSVQIADYFNNLQLFENELTEFVTNNFEGKDKDNKLKTITKKVQFQYKNLAQKQMQYATTIVYHLAEDIEKLGKNATLSLHKDDKEAYQHIPEKYPAYIPKKSTFSQILTTFLTTDATDEFDKSAAYDFIIQSTLYDLKTKINRLSTYLGLTTQAEDKYTYADMKNANDIVQKAEEKTAIYNTRTLLTAYQNAQANLLQYFIKPVERLSEKNSEYGTTLAYFLKDLKKIEDRVKESMAELDKYLPENAQIQKK